MTAPKLKLVEEDKNSPVKNILTDAKELQVSPLEGIPTDIPLPFCLYVKVIDNYILLRDVEGVLTKERKKSLEDKKVQAVYILKSQWNEFLTSLEQSMQLDSSENKEASAKQLRNIVMAYEKDWEEKKKIVKEQYEKIQIWGSWLTTTMAEDVSLGLKLLKHYSNPSLYYVNHSFNVAIYSALIGFRLKLPIDQVKELVLSALLHNTGNILIPQETLFTIEPLQPSQWTLLQSHTEKGATMLSAIRALEGVVQGALQHHERIDGKGYPKGLKGNEIHIYAKIISVADVYDALLSSRPHHPKVFTPKEAIKMMTEMTGKFDPAVFGLLNH